MDEYKEYLYQRRPDHYEKVDPGDLTKQKSIREKLQCKSFKWFMTNVAFDLPLKYPPVEPPDFANGVVQSLSNPDLCIDTLNRKGDEEIGVFACADNKKRPQMNQFFALSWHKDIRQKNGDLCWDVSKGTKDAPVLLYKCHGSQGNQLWRYDDEKKFIIHGRNNRCLDYNARTKKVFVNDCNIGNENMQWQFGYVNHTALKDWNNMGVKEEDR